MMARIIGLSLFAVALFSVLPVKAKAETGYEMLRPCGVVEGVTSGRLLNPSVNVEEANAQGFCLGMLAGIRFLAGGATKNTEYPICVPNNATRGQVLSVVVLYLRNHPEKLNEDFLWLAMDALREAWPCK